MLFRGILFSNCVAFISVVYFLMADSAVGHEFTCNIRPGRCARHIRQEPPTRDHRYQLWLCRLWLAAARDGTVSEKMQVLSLDSPIYARSHNVGRILTFYTSMINMCRRLTFRMTARESDSGRLMYRYRSRIVPYFTIWRLASSGDGWDGSERVPIGRQIHVGCMRSFIRQINSACDKRKSILKTKEHDDIELVTVR